MVYVINRNDYRSVGTNWIASYMNGNSLKNFVIFWVEYILKEITKFIGNKNIMSNIFRIQVYSSLICGYFCIWFINFMRKSLQIYSSLKFLTKMIG